MVALRDTSPLMTPEEYLDWEGKQELRYEYVDGEVYAMTGGTINHSAIAVNITTLLSNHLAGGGCRVLNSDAKVEILSSIRSVNNKSSAYLYPDISVTCDNRDRRANQFIAHPCLVIEVLSPSTEAYDRGKKFRLYQRSETLQEYVMVSTEEMAVEIYRKNDQGQWSILAYEVGDTVEFTSVELSVEIDRLFQGIVFEQEA